MASGGEDASRRHAEEQAELIGRLKRSLATVVEDNNDLREYNATLKKSQAQLLERSTELTETVERLRGELTESASLAARTARDLEDTRSQLADERARAARLAAEVNAFRETEGAIAAALAVASAEPASAEPSGTAAPSEPGMPAWLEAEARAGGEARSRSLKVQVLALRRALFQVARRAVEGGAEEEAVAAAVAEAVEAGGGPEAGGAGAGDAAGAGAAGADEGDPDGKAEAMRPLDRFRETLGVPASPTASEGPVMPPAALRSPSTASDATVADAAAAKAGPAGGATLAAADRETGVAIGFLGVLLAPPILLADALAAASEAVFGTDEGDEEAA